MIFLSTSVLVSGVPGESDKMSMMVWRGLLPVPGGGSSARLVEWGMWGIPSSLWDKGTAQCYQFVKSKLDLH